MSFDYKKRSRGLTFHRKRDAVVQGGPWHGGQIFFEIFRKFET